jgi:hypothetical protein
MEAKMDNKRDKKILGVNPHEKGSLRALVLFGLSATFIVGMVWYTAVSRDNGALLRTANLTPAVLPGTLVRSTIR